MSVIELIAELQEKNIQLWLENDQLRFSAPKNALNSYLRDKLLAQKADIIGFLRDNQTPNLPTISSVDHAQAQPLSFAQQRIWFLTQLQQHSQAFDIHCAFEINGQVDISRLAQAVNLLHQRHKILRTSYAQSQQGVFQHILPHTPIELTAEQLPAGIKSSYPQEMLTELLATQKTDFDLLTGKVSDCHLYKISNQHFIFTCAIHHIAADGWSMNLLAEEVLGAYQYPEHYQDIATIQYIDFAHWQQQNSHKQHQQQAIDYWQKTLADITPLQLPFDSARSLEQDDRGASYKFKLDRSVSLALNTLAEQQGVTLFSVLLSLLSALLYRYSQQQQFAIGTAIAGRNQAHCEALIGCFMNLLAIKSAHHSEQRFNELLLQIHQHFTTAMKYQDVAFESIVQALDQRRDLSTTPIFQVLFVLQNMPFNQSNHIHDLEISALQVDSQTAHYDLSLLANEWEGELFLEFNYRTALFQASSIKAMAEHFEQLIHEVLSEPQQVIARIALLNQQERERQTSLTDEREHTDSRSHSNSWQGPCKTRDYSVPIHAIIAEQAAHSPSAIALTYQNRELSYATVNQLSNRLANQLLLQPCFQLGRQVHIGICMERSLDLPIALLASLKAGACYIPFDPDLPAERLRYMAEECQLDILLTNTTEGWHTWLDGWQPNQPEKSAARVSIIDYASALECANDDSAPTISVDTQQLLNIIYTSGSTGNPKGVMVSHKALLNRLHWMQETFALDAQDRILQKTPFSFDVSVWEFFWPLMNGATLVIAEPHGHRDSRYLCELIRHRSVTLCHFVPSMLTLFLQHPDLEFCQSLRHIICSGESLQTLQVQTLKKRLPQCTISNLYGPTEAAIDVSYHHCDGSAEIATHPPIGRPISNTQIYLLDALQQLVPTGAIGEIYIGGDGLAKGYINKPTLSAESFIENPFLTKDNASSTKLYRSGDLARYDSQGRIHFLGRRDSQVKIRGFRVELGEIENSLRKYPAIKNCAVCIRHNREQSVSQTEHDFKNTTEYAHDNANSEIVAFYVADQKDMDVSLIRSFLAHQLPSYMLPQRFVAIDEIPLSTSGKVDRHALQQFQSELSEQTLQVEPGTKTEKKLAQIWLQLLDINKLSIHSNFFESGGHSLLATTLLLHIEQQFQVQIPLIDIFKNPTIYAVAALIDEHHVIQHKLANIRITDEPLGDNEEEISL